MGNRLSIIGQLPLSSRKLQEIDYFTLTVEPGETAQATTWWANSWCWGRSPDDIVQVVHRMGDRLWQTDNSRRNPLTTERAADQRKIFFCYVLEEALPPPRFLAVAQTKMLDSELVCGDEVSSGSD